MLNVAIENIKLNLNEERTLLSGVNFSLEKNKVFVILGENGSGKSTLLKTIPRLLDERFYNITGTIQFDGKDILSMDKTALLHLRKSKIKYIMQDAINSFDHLKRFKYYFEKTTGNLNETDELLKYFILPARDKLFKMFPYEVSGGMAQRISFVLALLAYPEIILLDEPTSGIDSAVSNLFLLKLREFVTVNNNCALLVTHDLKFAEKAGDKIAFLAKGKLSRFTSPGDFFNDKTGQTGSFINSYLQISE